MIRGVRGATTVEANKEQEILTNTNELLVEMIQQNSIKAEDVASVFISTTEDLNDTFPAKALRQVEGWTYVPVMCMQEIPVPNSLERCIRVMIHFNTEQEQNEVHHLYHNRAVQLRPDLVRRDEEE
ncbi:chorismate mutase [Pontibacillus yanchengensis]|uniref:chorismate mutase n=1 Tax=Pontibacillus yanchengensis Y32 TaxID=1385514 RepID=A0A0A2TUP8_9BACI|nr:chorismate mutase [Pontibacillus yanchengensis]KGP73015.1 chorismate mutase [Pontibacillus yanchengensis Y32]